MSKKLQGTMMLLLTALIWGSSFVAQRAGMEYIGPFTFNGIRSLIGGLVLIPVIFLFSKNKTAQEKKEELTEDEKKAGKKTLLLGGILCGIVLFAASSLQQIGMVYTTAGKAGFITALYIVLVPILGVFIRKKVKPIVWLCVILAVAGLYLLCMTDAAFRLTFGDSLVLLCALCFAVHIMTVDYFITKADGVKLSCIQFLTAGIEGMICMMIFESPDMGAILDCWLPILYAGVLSCGIGYTFQVVAQKHAEPTVASLIMSLESVFAVICGAILLSETMSARELSGCAIIFAAVIISQLPEKKRKEA